mgnify:CR=1 FL=1
MPESLTSVTLLAGKVPNYAFLRCQHIQTLSLPNYETATTFGYDSFEGCTGLTVVYIPSRTAWLNI